MSRRERASAWYHPPPRARSRRRKPRWGAEYFVSRGWLHLILLFGVGVFLFPLLWMAAVSMKTDDELTNGAWLPSMPRFVARSPYVRPAPAPARPIGVEPERFEKFLPMLVDVTRSAIDQANPVSPQHGAASATLLLNRMTGRISAKLWDGDEGALRDAYADMLTPEPVREAMSDRLARFELRGLLFRTLDGHVTKVSDPKAIASTWKLDGGHARLVAMPEGGAYVEYAFDDASDEPVAIRYDFDLPADFAQMHKLMVSYQADSSWHRIDAELDVGGQRWVGQRATYLAQGRPASILLQPPTFEDRTFKKKVWTPLKLVSAVPSDQPRRVTLRLRLSPSSTLDAIGAKVRFNYDRAFHDGPFWRYVLNSALLVALCTAGTLFSSTFVAYAFARLRWPGRSVAFVLLLSTMMLPAQVTMIPQFMIWRELGWYNTLNPLWVPSWFGVAFFIFMMVQHMKTIPRELEEAARIDGLNAVQTWWYVIVPLVKPAAAAIAIMAAMGAWNDFMGPLIYLRDQAKFPLSLGLWGMRTDFTAGIDWTLLMAGNMLMTLPVIVLFFFFQRYFIQGMAMSGMKG
jgi:ABC-type glycerol-3-phosphate transport system permease component